MEDNFISKDSLKPFRLPSWPHGTEVVVMCYEDELEGVTEKVESIGYKVVSHVEPNNFQSNFLPHGQFLMMKKPESIHWIPRRDSAIYKWFNRKVF